MKIGDVEYQADFKEGKHSIIQLMGGSILENW
jgi:hypothetical protein